MGASGQPTIRVNVICETVFLRFLLRVTWDFRWKRMLVVVVNWNVDNPDNGRHGQCAIKVRKQVTVSRRFPDNG